jgi:hypothetical protein
MRKVESDGVKGKALKLKSKGSAPSGANLSLRTVGNGFFLPAAPTCTCNFMTILAGRWHGRAKNWLQSPALAPPVGGTSAQGRFLGMIGWDLSVSKSNMLHVDILWYFFINFRYIP